MAPARWLGRGGCQGGDALESSVVQAISVGVTRCGVGAEVESEVVDQATNRLRALRADTAVEGCWLGCLECGSGGVECTRAGRVRKWARCDCD